MSKVGKFLKNNIKLFVGIIIGGILFGGATYVVATEIASSSVTYTGNGQSTVEGAINDLYGKASDLDAYKDGLKGYIYWNDNFSGTSYDTSNPPTGYLNYSNLVTSGTNGVFSRVEYSEGNASKIKGCLYYNDKVYCAYSKTDLIDAGLVDEDGFTAASGKTAISNLMQSVYGVAPTCGSISYRPDQTATAATRYYGFYCSYVGSAGWKEVFLTLPNCTPDPNSSSNDCLYREYNYLSSSSFAGVICTGRKTKSNNNFTMTCSASVGDKKCGSSCSTLTSFYTG